MAQKRRQPEIIAGRVNADGSIAAGDGFTSQRTSAGNYTITLAAGMRVIAAVTSPLGSQAVVRTETAYGSQSFNVLAFGPSTLAVGDSAFTFIAVGIQQ
jgi:hypothetical protein